MNSWLLLSLLTAHVIGDFYLQSDKYCKRKEVSKLLSIYSCNNHGATFMGVCSNHWFLALCVAHSCNTFFD